MCYYILSYLIKRFEKLENIPKKYFNYLGIFIILLFIILINTLNMFDESNKIILLWLYFILFAIVGFLFALRALFGTQGDIKKPSFAIMQCFRIFGGLMLLIFLLFNGIETS